MTQLHKTEVNDEEQREINTQSKVKEVNFACMY